MSYSIDLSGRVAFVTGASSGLGAQFARALARAGAGVVLASRRMERLKDLRAQIEAEGRGRACRQPGRDLDRQHQGRPSRTPRPRWDRSTSS